MPNSARVILNEIDLTHSTQAAPLGIVGFMVGTERGPIADPSLLITSWPQFQRVYGGLSNDNDGPLICKRALDRGCQLRISRVVHYDDPTDASTLDAEEATLPTSTNAQSAKISLDGDFATGDTGKLTIGSTEETLTLGSNAEASIISFANYLKGKYLTQIADAYYGGSDNSGTGGALRHYLIIIPNGDLTLTGDDTDDVTTTVTRYSKVSNSDSGNEYFKVTSKYPGEKYNDLLVKILPASNGDDTYFNLFVGFTDTTQYDELYQNIKIIGKPSVEDSHYLDNVLANSFLISIEYQNLSSETDASLRPANVGFKLAGGSDGSDVDDNDYIGDSGSKTGFYAFDQIEDIMDLAAPNLSSSTVHIAGFGYAENRKDIDYLAHLSNTLENVNAIITERDSTNIDSSYGAFYVGGVRVSNPIGQTPKEISELGDIAGVIVYSDSKYGPWYSFAGQNRGKLINVMGPVNNFGGVGQYNDLNELAKHQINAVVAKSGKVFLSGNFTAQKSISNLSYMNVRRLNLYIKKTLKPFLEYYLEEPNDISTWRKIYQEVKPFLSSLKAKRAIYDFDWQGDQDAKDMDSLKINVPADVQQGKYKVRLFTKDIVSLQEVGVDIILSPAGVNFEDLNQLLSA